MIQAAMTFRIPSEETAQGGVRCRAKAGLVLSVKKFAEYRGQNFSVITLDVGVEVLGQGQQRVREGGAVRRCFRYPIFIRGCRGRG